MKRIWIGFVWLTWGMAALAGMAWGETDPVKICSTAPNTPAPNTTGKTTKEKNKDKSVPEHLVCIDAAAPSTVYKHQGETATIPRHFANGHSVYFQLYNVNPFQQGCKLNTTVEPVTEPDLSVILKMFGGVAANLNVAGCSTDVSETEDARWNLKSAESALACFRAKNNKLIDQLASAPSKEARRDLVNKANPSFGNVDQVLADLPGEISTYEAEMSDADFRRHGKVEIDQLKSRLAAAAKLRAALSESYKQILAIVSNPNLDHDQKEISVSQSTATVSVVCTPVKIQYVDFQGSAIDDPAKTLAENPSKKSDNSKEIYSRIFTWGMGQRFFIAGGLVVSTLGKREYTTVPDPAAPATATAKNLIVFKNKSDTRILPLLAVHARFWDNEDSPKVRWLPNYLSAGVTAKPDDKGTSVEYLFGPSWSLAGHGLFLTVGAYAGQQQRLLVPDASAHVSYTDATLPVAKEYHWRPGFSLTWSPGSKAKSKNNDRSDSKKKE